MKIESYYIDREIIANKINKTKLSISLDRHLTLTKISNTKLRCRLNIYQIQHLYREPKKIKANIIKIIKDDTGVEMSNSYTRTFTANDLIGGKFTFVHSLNSKKVDVTVFDNFDRIIEVSSQAIDLNSTQIDLTRCFIPTSALWSVLAEK